jgi:hypothetical protein
VRRSSLEDVFQTAKFISLNPGEFNDNSRALDPCHNSREFHLGTAGRAWDRDINFHGGPRCDFLMGQYENPMESEIQGVSGKRPVGRCYENLRIERDTRKSSLFHGNVLCPTEMSSVPRNGRVATYTVELPDKLYINLSLVYHLLAGIQPHGLTRMQRRFIRRSRPLLVFSPHQACARMEFGYTV